MHLQYLFIGLVSMGLTAAIPIVDLGDLVGGNPTGGGFVGPVGPIGPITQPSFDDMVKLVTEKVAEQLDHLEKTTCYTTEYECGFLQRCFRYSSGCGKITPTKAKTLDEILLEVSKNLRKKPGDLQREHLKKEAEKLAREALEKLRKKKAGH
ncbi:hypothetical protein BGZ83_004894 [Gryganskiella cystojenkinii]|nr:hypothetical protein BGZ83_004894 [Gryganskiella cystojenkinii]